MYEWSKCQNGTFARDLKGGEKIFEALEKGLDGHSELTACVTFEIDQMEDEGDALTRLQEAWMAMYQAEPAVGLFLDADLYQLQYRPWTSSTEAQTWLSDHFKIVQAHDGQALFSSVIGQAMSTPRHGACLHITKHEATSRISIALQISHIICDGFAIQQLLDKYLSLFVDGAAVDFKSLESDESILAKLPVSLGFAYHQQYQPSQAEHAKSVEFWTKSMSVHAKPSMAVGDTTIEIEQRPHTHQSERIFLNEQEILAVKASAKAIGVHVFSLIVAAYLTELLQSHGLFADKADGIKVNVPLATNRWIDGRQQAQRGPVLCAPLAGLLRVSVSKYQPLAGMAESVQAMISEQSSVPHALHPAGTELFVDAFVKVLKETGDNFPPSYPGVSYAGSTPIKKQYKGKMASITSHFFRSNSRARNNRPFFVVLGIWGQLSLEVMYDSKYYDGGRLLDVLQRTKHKLLTADLEGTTKEAHL